jgi:large subunit ribosomal protein L22
MDLIRGEGVDSALTKLRLSARRGAPLIRKVVESAVANATQKAGLEPESLIVHRAYVDEGPTMKRWRPRSMGRAYPRLKRTCHLTVVLKEAAKTEERERASPGAGGGGEATSSPSGDQED